jgi:hypothetical protein
VKCHIWRHFKKDTQIRKDRPLVIWEWLLSEAWGKQIRKRQMGWGCSPVVEHLHGVCTALGVILSSVKRKKKKRLRLSRSDSKIFTVIGV